VATLSDIYINSRSGYGSKEVKQAKVTTATTPTGSRPIQKYNTEGHRGGHNTSSVRRCYECKALGYIAKDCPRNRGGGTPRLQRGGYNRAHVTLWTTKSPTLTHEVGVQYDLSTENSDHSRVESVTVIELTPTVKIYPLQLLGVNVAGYDCMGLNDGGAQIPVVSERMFTWCKDDAVGSVQLHGFGRGHTIHAPLVNLAICVNEMNTSDVNRPTVVEVPIVCAVADFEATDYDVILPSDIVREIQHLPKKISPVSVLDNPGDDSQDLNTEELDNGSDANSQYPTPDDAVSVDIPLINDAGQGSSEVDKFMAEQRLDPTLSQWWALAEGNKEGFTISRGLLYHNDRVEGQPVCQLCVPQGRRDEVLKLAHDFVFGGHMGERKTFERVRLSFYWPKMRKCIKYYVATCVLCQLRSRTVVTDRVPITPITRADVPFQVMNMDCIGPLPTTSQGEILLMHC